MSTTTPFLYFDDTNPAFQYSSGWSEASNVNGVFNKTLKVTTTVGATVQFNFEASQIIIIGATTAPPNAGSNDGPVSSYALDGSKNSAFLYQADVQNATAVTFFNSGPLTEGKHSLEISVLSVADNVPFLFDAIALSQPQDVPTSTAIWVSTVFVTPSSAASSALDRNTATNSSSSSLPVGAIVGGVIGGIALIVVSVLAFYFLYWRQRRRDYDYHGFSRGVPFDAGEKAPLASDAAGVTGPAAAPHISVFVTPYAPGSPPTASVQYSDQERRFSVYSTSSSVPVPAASHVYPPTPGSVVSGASGSGSVRTLSAVNAGGDSGAALALALDKTAEKQPSDEKIVQFHSDSGVRFDSEGRPLEASGSGSGSQEEAIPPVVDVPPEYSEM